MMDFNYQTFAYPRYYALGFHSKFEKLKPGLHIVVMVASTVADIFLTLFQAVLIHVNSLITT